jgi:hypothetical protein
MTKGILAADTHTGHVLGLTPPDYWQGRCRGLQKGLWDWWAGEIKQIGPVDFAIFDGDLVDGPGRKETLGLWTTDSEEQADAAAEALSIVRARERYVCYGTPLHTVTSLSIENLVASKLNAEIRDTLRLKIKGRSWEVRFNTRHVQGRSDIPAGQGAQTGKEIIREMLQSLIEDFKPADILSRAHTHYWFRIEIARRTGISLPALMLPDPDRGRMVYARRLRTLYYDVGLAYVEIDRQGEVYIRRRLMPLKMIVPQEYICLKADAS